VTRPARRHAGRAWLIGAALAAATPAGCGPAEPLPPGALTLPDVIAARHLAGDWEWRHITVEDGTVRRERERWQFEPTADRTVLTGRYQRDVLVRALDGVPFTCNQQTRYAQRAEFAVRAQIVAGGARVAELSYIVAPSPCDPGLRTTTSYRATLHHDRLRLTWDGGDAELERAEAEPVEAPPAPVAPPPSGRWTWSLRSYDRAGLVEDEHEEWELTAAPDGRIAGSYLRTVTVRDPEGAPVACAHGPGYRFVDRYLVRGAADGDGWRLDETAVSAGQHPCLAGTPRRTLDGARATAVGDYLVLEWRGRRRQVLTRP